MKRTDDFQKRRQHLAGLSDAELTEKFWSETAKVVEPLLEMGKQYTTPSIERSVLLRMGISSLDAKPIVEGCIDRGLLGKGAGHVVYRVAKARQITIQEAGRELAAGQGWDEAAALFGK